MKLGRLDLKNNLILAPMQNVTTAPFRRFCRHFYPIGLMTVPMIYAKRIASNPKSIQLPLMKIKEEKPISIQVIGEDAEALKKTLEYLESYNHDILDINAGCPSRRAIKAAHGGFLLKKLDKLKEIVEIALKYSSVPVSLKIRTGFEEPLNVKKFCELFNDLGIEFLTVHGRTVKHRFERENLDFETIKKLKEHLDIPIVGNGDIFNGEMARYYIEHVKVDALMIGRACIGNPFIFKQIDEYLKTGNWVPHKNDLERMQKNLELYEKIIDQFLENIEFPYNKESYKFIELKRNSIWLTKDIENSTDIRMALSNAKNLHHLKRVLNGLFSN
ncbi:MAG: tRNA dihydrouridine synthase [Promethearchaeota archaeon]